MTVYTIFGITAVIALALGLIRYFTNKPQNIGITYLQDFVGAFFIFSGFVKAVDPLGTSYKMHEYFEAFAAEGMRPLWEALAGFSTFFAITMIAAELFIGLMLIIGWMPRFTLGVIWWLTLFFTLLTGYTFLSGYGITLLFIGLAVIAMVIFAAAAIPSKNSTRLKIVLAGIGLLVIMWGYSKVFHTAPQPGAMDMRMVTTGFEESKMKVTDCGCFGDFIKLKPWETFYKDVILDVMILVLLFSGSQISSLFNNKARTGLAIGAGVVSLLFCLYNVYLNEPVIDFRPYAVGSDIVDARIVKREPKIEMQWQYHNKATGQWETVTYDQVMKNQVNYDNYDTSYREDKILDPGIPAKIKNLRIENDEGMDMTDTLLADPNYSMMVVMYNMKKTHADAYKQLNEIAAGCDKKGIKFYVVTVDDGTVDEFRHQNQTAYPFYHADETPLKTIIRSNPGLVLFKKGVVVNKWHYRHFPTFEELNSQYFSK